MRLYLIRHPRPLIGPDVCYGSTDIESDPAHCDQVYASLLASLPKRTPLYSSPLRRCLDLAQRLASRLGERSVISDPRLAEIHFGNWELRAWNDIPRAEIDAWAKDTLHYRPGGGESVLDAATRVHQFYIELMHIPHQEAVIVCHAGTIRLLRACQHRSSVVDIASDAVQTRQQAAFGEVILIDNMTQYG